MMKGTPILLGATLLIVASGAPAQVLQWRQIDRTGKVLRDLAHEPIDTVMWEPFGWARVTLFEPREPGKPARGRGAADRPQSVISPAGVLLPGRFARIQFNGDGSIVIASETVGGPVRYFDRELRPLTEAEFRSRPPAATPTPADDSGVKVVRVDRETGAGKSARYVLEVDGRKVSEEYSTILPLAKPQRAIVYQDLPPPASGRAAGLIDFKGARIVPVDGQYFSISGGDPLFMVFTRARTIMACSRDTIAFIDADGRQVIPFERYGESTGFRNGVAWVCTVVRNPDLEAFHWPEYWFTDNRTMWPQGEVKGNGHGVLVCQTQGKYAMVYLGPFANGSASGPGASLFDPARGRFDGTFANGRLEGVGTWWLKDGRRIDGTFVAGVAHGHGHSRRRNGSLEFVGQYRDGVPWEGTIYLETKNAGVEQVKQGRNLGWAPYPGYDPKPKPAPREPSVRLTSCPYCNGTGEVFQKALYQWVPDTSLIFAGHRLYGSQWTHFELDTGRNMVVRECGYVACPRCGGRGHIPEGR